MVRQVHAHSSCYFACPRDRCINIEEVSMGGRMKRWLCCSCQTEDSRHANDYENQKSLKALTDGMFFYPLCLLVYKIELW